MILSLYKTHASSSEFGILYASISWNVLHKKGLVVK